MINYPRYVALCGAPMSGKTTAALFLATHYRAQLVDDGLPLRLGISRLFAGAGVEEQDPFTQEGKKRQVTVCGKTYEVRQLLGDVGNMLEHFYGDQIMPELAIGSIEECSTPHTPFFIFPSCRKNQGLTYRQRGGLVIEIKRAGYDPVNDFDRYDQSLVTHTISNDGTLEEFEASLVSVFDGIYGVLE